MKNHINQTALKRVVSILSQLIEGKVVPANLTKAELEDTADLYVSLAKNASITGQSMAVGELMPFCPCEEDKLTSENDRRRLRYSLNSQRLHRT